jgi:ATP-dependent 26S proteasome regulatory subunit
MSLVSRRSTNRSAPAAADPGDFKVQVRKVERANGLDLDAIAGQATGFTGADIASLVNEAERRRRTIFRRSGDSHATSKYAALPRVSRVLMCNRYE